MAKSQKTVKAPAVDLGALQKRYDDAKRNLARDDAAAERAVKAFERSKAAFVQAGEELKNAAKTVLS